MKYQSLFPGKKIEKKKKKKKKKKLKMSSAEIISFGILSVQILNSSYEFNTVFSQNIRTIYPLTIFMLKFAYVHASVC